MPEKESAVAPGMFQSPEADALQQKERAEQISRLENLDPTSFCDEFLRLFNDFTVAELAEILRFITVESAQSVELEQALYEHISTHYVEDKRFRIVSTEVAGEPCEFITVLPLTNIQNFTIPINPFIRKDPLKTHVGYHDTTYYSAHQLETKGLANPLEAWRDFYVHPMHMFAQEYWVGAWLARLRSYGKQYLDPDQVKIFERRKYKYPPLESRKTDFRSARIAVIAPQLAYRDRDDRTVAAVFDHPDEIKYELHVGAAIPADCIVVTNIYHALISLREMIAEGFWKQSEEIETYYLKPAVAEYAHFGIDEETGVAIQ